MINQIRDHYDKLTPLYARFWGRHIHHGFWKTGTESIKVAQVQMIEELARAAQIPRGATVLDIGCGLGGSSMWLAHHRDCRVQGITLSSVQAAGATKEAAKQGLSERTQFRVMDANNIDFPSQSFDAIWIVECSEHIFDKPAFFNRCYDLLKPGGVIGVCAWLNGENIAIPENETLVKNILDAMVCPSFGSLEDYTGWFLRSGFERIEARDVTAQVAPTWDRCVDLLKRPDVRIILALSSKPTKIFASSFEWMRRAFETKAMAYGMFSARKG